MAYNPDVPAPINRVQDDIAAMRGNFQHLAPLAQVVGELQTVSGLAPVANELQTVSGLAPVVEELQAVSGLAPYVQAILDSRIVDHNLDVTTAPNGRYVRLDSGLQVCYGEATFTNLDAWMQISTSGWYINPDLGATVTLPAQFVSTNNYEVIPVERQWGLQLELKGLGVAFCYKLSAGSFGVCVSRFGSGVIPNTSIGWIAIGRWK